MSRQVSIGGQAVMEGVMMRGPKKMSIAVRRPDGTISVIIRSNWRLADFLPLFKLPVFRGIAAFVEALVVGIDAIMLSANESQTEDMQLSKGQAIFSLLIGLCLGIILFMLLPTWLVRFLEGFGLSPFWLNLTEGVLRLSIFLLYVLAIGFYSEMHRFFQYHGAEHKSIYAYEAGEALELSSTRKYSCLHPRCGTAFLLQVMLISIIAFSFLGWPGLLMRILSRLALLPLIAGLAYEVSRFSGKNVDNKLVRMLIKPGLWLQRATTREPDDNQVEVALAAIDGLLAADPELAAKN